MHNQNLIQFIDYDDDFDVDTMQTQQPNLGVRFVQSDPIHGSLGPDKAKRADLTPEQQFEWDQRRVKKHELVDDPEEVTNTNDSIAAAEKITGFKMPDPLS